MVGLTVQRKFGSKRRLISAAFFYSSKGHASIVMVQISANFNFIFLQSNPCRRDFFGIANSIGRVSNFLSSFANFIRRSINYSRSIPSQRQKACPHVLLRIPVLAIKRKRAIGKCACRVWLFLSPRNSTFVNAC